VELFVTPPRSSENTLSGSVTTTFFHEQPLTRLSPADRWQEFCTGERGAERGENRYFHGFIDF